MGGLIFREGGWERRGKTNLDMCPSRNKMVFICERRSGSWVVGVYVDAALGTRTGVVGSEFMIGIAYVVHSSGGSCTLWRLQGKRGLVDACLFRRRGASRIGRIGRRWQRIKQEKIEAGKARIRQCKIKALW